MSGFVVYWGRHKDKEWHLFEAIEKAESLFAQMLSTYDRSLPLNKCVYPLGVIDLNTRTILKVSNTQSAHSHCESFLYEILHSTPIK